MRIDWPELDMNVVAEQLAKKNFDFGSAAFFVPWPGGEVGLKLFTSKKQRLLSARAQARAAKHGLGPRVGPWVTVHLPVAQILVDGSDVDVVWDALGYPGFFTEAVQHVAFCSLEEIEATCDALNDVGIDCWDKYPANFGRLDGRVVCIDFDYQACRVTPLRDMRKGSA